MRLSDSALDQLFLAARTHKRWLPSKIADAKLRDLYDLVSMGPTSNNGSPARFTFVTSEASRNVLMPCIDTGNRPKIANAAVICVLSYDESYWRFWQTLSPHKNLEQIFADSPAAREEALRSSLLQAGYFIIAARSLGLDVFPLQGFDPNSVAESLLRPGWRPFLLCCLGQGDPSALRPRAARLSFEQACNMA